MKTKENKKFVRIMLIVITSIICIIIGIGYARYVKQISGSVTGNVAGFLFNVTVGEESSLNIDLAQTRIEHDTDKVAIGDIAPRN